MSNDFLIKSLAAARDIFLSLIICEIMLLVAVASIGPAVTSLPV